MHKTKQVVVNPLLTLIVVETSDWYEDPTEDQADALRKKIRENTDFDGPVLVLPPGCKLKAIPLGGVYHRERLGDYEMEIIAESEKDIRQRLETMQEINQRKVV